MGLATTSTSSACGPIGELFDLQVEVMGLSRDWTYGRWAVAGKRLIDFVGAGVGLALLFPLLLAVACVIRLTSRGPVFFTQVRMGMGGEPFLMYKFRTMAADAEQRLKDLEDLNESDGGVLFKIKSDPRVTRIGRILRRTNLDELPQLYNVLRGEMSLVGPRPLQLRDSALLAQSDRSGFGRRLMVLPGVTGPWQASDRSETGFAHMVRLDIEYVEHWSLWLDFHIILKTFLSMANGNGS